MSGRSFGGSAGGGKKGSGVKFVRQEPAFLKRMKAAAGYKEPEEDLEAKRAKLEEDDREDRDDERPTVVVLREGDLTQEEADKQWDKHKEQEQGKTAFS